MPVEPWSRILFKTIFKLSVWGPYAFEGIRHFHIVHNALCLPPKILHKHCFQFLLRLTIVPKEIENNAYAKFLGVNETTTTTTTLYLLIIFLQLFFSTTKCIMDNVEVANAKGSLE